MSTDIGIDLGTASILVYIKGKGVVLKEPSVVAFDRDTNKIKAIGEEARLMLGRTPGNIVAVRPLRQGVISDYTVTEKMLRYFIQKSCGKSRFRKPRISVCVPSGVTEVEKKAVEDATYEAGAREVHYIPIYMKKNRPAYELVVICGQADIDKLQNIIFRQTTTIGIRRTAMERTILKRHMEKAVTPYGEVDIKVCELPDGGTKRYPEYESVKKLCETQNVSYMDVINSIKNI